MSKKLPHILQHNLIKKVFRKKCPKKVLFLHPRLLGPKILGEKKSVFRCHHPTKNYRGVKILPFAKKYAPCEVSHQNYLAHFFTKGKIHCWKNFTNNFFRQTYNLRGQKGRKIIKIFWGDFLIPNFKFIALTTFEDCLNQKRGRFCKKSYKLIQLKFFATF